MLADVSPVIQAQLRTNVPKAPGLRQYISLRIGITVPKGRTNNLLTPGVQSVEKV